MFLWKRAYRKAPLLPGSALIPVVIDADAGSCADLASDLEVAQPAAEQPAQRYQARFTLSFLVAQRSVLSAVRCALLPTILKRLCR